MAKKKKKDKKCNKKRKSAFLRAFCGVMDSSTVFTVLKFRFQEDVYMKKECKHCLWIVMQPVLLNFALNSQLNITLWIGSAKNVVLFLSLITLKSLHQK